ncbi:graves disease carrier protein isoform X3 [Scyliorhinus canicula]|uniref:graves disease carrier protein isoform X3 n=1 Tax=Scyliorhinus canicula TaxID=7830 RepID=UPI0018F4408A|nr:graves disease carrier protein isoform X3 [Scyliorhinus canicula]
MATEASIPSGAKSGVATPTHRDFFWLRSLVAGGVAGCCAKSTIAPLDRVKILLQAHNRHYKHLGVFSTLRAVPKKEGFLGLYKGNGAMMVRIFPYGAIQFTAFDRYRKLLIGKLGISGHIHRLMAGSMAGMTAVICTYPLDMIRARLAFQVKGEHRYPLDVARRRMQLGSILIEADKYVNHVLQWLLSLCPNGCHIYQRDLSLECKATSAVLSNLHVAACLCGGLISTGPGHLECNAQKSAIRCTDLYQCLCSTNLSSPSSS